MAQDVLVKVYGHVWPVAASIVQEFEPHFPPSEHMEKDEMLDFDKDMLRFCYEGIYFDVDTVLPVIHKHLTSQSQGKIDYIDLEAWTLTRYVIMGKEITVSSASLNVVMEYSGH